MRSLTKVLCFSSIVCLVVSAWPWAGWIEDGIPLTPHTGYGGGIVLVSDGSSGAFLAYEACRNAASYVIVQRLDSEGDILWGEGGVVVCSEAGGQYDPRIISDGSGGVIVAWSDYRGGSYDIYAQRVDGSGTVQWQAEGVPICTAAEDQEYTQITTDDSGGAVVTWEDERSGEYVSDIYAQRVDGSGTVLWQADGVPLCTAAEDQSIPQITSDCAGGAIVTWEDSRGGSSDIYAQRVGASGTVLWMADGVPLCTAANVQLDPQITTDGSGGAIVTWWDYRSDYGDIYAQRVDGLGLTLWQAHGIPLCTAANYQAYPQITTDGSGGAIVTWYDTRSSVSSVIYAQRISGLGMVQWQADGIRLCVASGDQTRPKITTDGSGGAIVTWWDYRSGYWDIYAQRVDGSGFTLWTINGVPTCTAAENQYNPQITSDGSGGAIVTWEDSRSGSLDIYSQRVDGSGTVLWQADGISLCTAAHDQWYPKITSDGSGGAIVTWQDYRSGSNYDVYVQRMDGSGTIIWQADGIPLSAAAGDQKYPQITSDGSGGAIVIWQDERSGNYDIYAQRVDAMGLTGWATNGVPLCTEANNQYDLQITTDGSGGAIVTWRDSRSGSSDIYAQRVDGSGSVLLQADGIPLCTADGLQSSQQITSDGSGGAIVTWQDERCCINEYEYDIYAQRMDGSGTVLWQADGVPICTAAESQVYPEIILDGLGGAIVTWQDVRGGGSDIYAQRVDGSGTLLWQADGVPLCTAAHDQWHPKITSDGSDGAIVTWYDPRSGDSDIYAQRVDGSGMVLWIADGVPLCTAAGGQRSPQITPAGSGGAIVTWIDERCCISEYEYDIYAQRMDGSGSVLWQADGIPLCTADGLQSSQQITSDGSGGAIVTWQDERCGSFHIYAARVSDSGDLVATLLQTFSARLESNSVFISWTLSEIDESASFAVLRASAPDWIYTEIEDEGIERDGLSFSFTDTAILPGSLCKYRVDIETEGVPARTLFETEEITVPALPLTLYQNHPNPFNPNTTIRFYLPEAQEVYLDIYNVAGQKVRRLAEGRREKGHQEVLWDGRNSRGAECSSGIYFYRLRAGKSSISRKMVLLR